MNETIALTSAPPSFAIGYCEACSTYTYPPQAYGCRRCGLDELRPVALPGAVTLKNFVTLQTALATELEVPCVIGEVQLAPGVIEEALIHVDNEEKLHIGQQLQPHAYQDTKNQWRWRFSPSPSQETAS